MILSASLLKRGFTFPFLSAISMGIPITRSPFEAYSLSMAARSGISRMQGGQKVPQTLSMVTLFLEKTSSVTGFPEKSRDEKYSFEEAASFEKIKAASSRAIKNKVIFFISFKYTAKGRKGKKNYKNLFDKSTRVN